MHYQDWEQAMLAEPENDLAGMVASFREDADTVWYTDRHVFGVEPPAFDDLAVEVAGVRAGLALLRRWVGQRPAVIDKGVLVSQPYLIIEDEWLAREEDAPPPHLYLCLAKNEAEFKPVDYQGGVRRSSLGRPDLDALLAGDEILLRIEGRGEVEGDDEPVRLWRVELPVAGSS